MAYIKQKNAEVAVVLSGYSIENHPAIAAHPDLFEVVEGDVPPGFDWLIFSEEE